MAIGKEVGIPEVIIPELVSDRVKSRAPHKHHRESEVSEEAIGLGEGGANGYPERIILELEEAGSGKEVNGPFHHLEVVPFRVDLQEIDATGLRGGKFRVKGGDLHFSARDAVASGFCDRAANPAVGFLGELRGPDLIGDRDIPDRQRAARKALLKPLGALQGRLVGESLAAGVLEHVIRPVADIGTHVDKRADMGGKMVDERKFPVFLRMRAFSQMICDHAIGLVADQGCNLSGRAGSPEEPMEGILERFHRSVGPALGSATKRSDRFFVQEGLEVDQIPSRLAIAPA